MLDVAFPDANPAVSLNEFVAFFFILSHATRMVKELLSASLQGTLVNWCQGVAFSDQTKKSDSGAW